MMTGKTEAPPTPFFEYWTSLSARKWLIALFVLSTLISAFLISKATAVYQTSATVILGPSANSIFSTTVALAQVITSDDILKDVISKEKLEYSVAELRGRVRGEKVTETGMVIITVTDSNGARAKKICDAIAAKFVEKVNALDVNSRKSLKEQAESLKEQLKAVDDMIAEVTELTGPETDQGVRVNFILPKQALLNQKLGLIGQRQALMIELDKTGSTTVLAPAVEPAAPQTNIPRNTALAGLASLIAGAGLAIALGPTAKKDLP